MVVGYEGRLWDGQKMRAPMALLVHRYPEPRSRGYQRLEMGVPYPLQYDIAAIVPPNMIAGLHRDVAE